MVKNMNWFAGSTFRIWWDFLILNKQILTPNNWLKIIFISLQAFRNSRVEKKEAILLADSDVNSVELKDPIFILGHWRSGTSHLHNILVNDNNFNFPTLLQVTFPNTFLAIQDKMKSQNASHSNRRPMDNMQISIQSPGEEEVAVWSMCSISSIGNRLLQNKEDFYDKFLTFEDTTKDEFSKWRSSFIYFLKKITLNDKRQLLLKSPEHTARIKLLLEIFPNAKFINIRRNPLDVFQSTKHLYDKVIKPSYFHKVSNNHLVDRILLVYKKMYESYFQDIHLISEGNFVDISYENLVAQPMLTVEKIYGDLDLVLLKSTKDRIESYINPHNKYKKNEYKDIDPKLKERVYTEWNQNFRNWDYDKKTI